MTRRVSSDTRSRRLQKHTWIDWATDPERSRTMRGIRSALTLNNGWESEDRVVALAMTDLINRHCEERAKRVTRQSSSSLLVAQCALERAGTVSDPLEKCGSAAPFDAAHGLFEPELIEGLGGGTATGGPRRRAHGRAPLRSAATSDFSPLCTASTPLLTFGQVMQCSKRRPGAADLHGGPGIQGVPVGRAPSPDRLGLPLLIQISVV